MQVQLSSVLDRPLPDMIGVHRCRYAMGGAPLAVTQEDYLVGQKSNRLLDW